jgi:FkbM family methyltransferase
MSVSKAERKAALDLFPYFNQQHPVVFDVGSNKGVWADILVHNVAEIHLFEPNEILLHYTMAKYDYLSNVEYWNTAISVHQGTAQFNYFTNNNNGLSNIVGNKWEGLPVKVKEVKVCTLDYAAAGVGIPDLSQYDIDFLKLDIEGAEYLALQGANYLLSQQAIKFIQVEKADHIHYTGKTFQDVVDYLKSFGYIPMQTEDTENVIFMQEGFTQDWNGQFKKNTTGLKFNFALEIGAFEGLTSRYICDNLLNEGGRMIVVDPLTDEYLPGHPDNEMFVGQYERFSRNTRNYPIELIREKSIDAFRKLEDYRFDFIYIDGDHTRDAVFIDGCNAFRLAKIGGHILFDDYEWREETKQGIDSFLESHKGKYQIVEKSYQVMIKKLEE